MHFSKISALLFAAAASVNAQREAPIASGHAGSNCFTKDWHPIDNSTCTAVSRLLSISFFAPGKCTVYGAGDEVCGGEGKDYDTTAGCLELSTWENPGSVNCIGIFPYPV
ncbi:hypothetical protein VFPFJ_09964 [Purpureocillium lilacinum]|uniref:Uncharacterized protein n=1 Tax=Purpureocillium lilacinum TaxID=33203 RepID=A0A179GPQ9_PURLI|nr:hypothetical protein VFPFJ_09964 [Purpureocillium lilacinum]KAK4094509.1 hypothetical protein Purlil1_1114 [Purpureocillium lilacinum]OAQ76397.1 hypothetical protein VFPBJ_08757 [Purpureocillium lilacinum]OAQ79478.1 hypothetical protein VFPFJ_09964 [Purpureocillium lilacinum]PWI72847.1 hypothetical protein PCL_09862 [Purpureocillium lilacinum]GJN70191.1 hypothetical protein PLICBS_004244 [Purpureocillium lilacinum]